jgi:hypothetical protein
VHDVEHAGREASLLEQIPDQHRCGGITFGRLQDKRVPASDGDRIHPHRHHSRKVEGRDAGDDPERLAVGPAVDLGADIAAVLALQEMRDAAGEIDDVDAAGELACRVGMRLAVLVRNRPGDLVGVTIKKLLEAKHGLDALERRRRAPADGGLLGGRDGFIHILGARERQIGGLVARGGVVDRRDAPR